MLQFQAKARGAEKSSGTATGTEEFEMVSFSVIRGADIYWFDLCNSEKHEPVKIEA